MCMVSRDIFYQTSTEIKAWISNQYTQVSVVITHPCLFFKDRFCYTEDRTWTMTILFSHWFRLYRPKWFWICNCSPFKMFFSLGLLLEFRIEHATIGLLLSNNTLSYVIVQGSSGLCNWLSIPIWRPGLTTCPLYVSTPFDKLVLINSWSSSLV